MPWADIAVCRRGIRAFHKAKVDGASSSPTQAKGIRCPSAWKPWHMQNCEWNLHGHSQQKCDSLSLLQLHRICLRAVEVSSTARCLPTIEAETGLPTKDFYRPAAAQQEVAQAVAALPGAAKPAVLQVYRPHLKPASKCYLRDYASSVTSTFTNKF